MPSTIGIVASSGFVTKTVKVTASGTWSPPTGITASSLTSFFAVGGGGGGDGGGGGGGKVTVPATVTCTGSVAIIIGAGGLGYEPFTPIAATNGSATTLTNITGVSSVAGGNKGNFNAPYSGGTSGDGFAGGTGVNYAYGGGGGATAVGTNGNGAGNGTGGNGGAGRTINSVVYGGGGGGGAGSFGATGVDGTPYSAPANSGQGGGASGGIIYFGADGGSGYVEFKYLGKSVSRSGTGWTEV